MNAFDHVIFYCQLWACEYRRRATCLDTPLQECYRYGRLADDFETQLVYWQGQVQHAS